MGFGNARAGNVMQGLGGKGRQRSIKLTYLVHLHENLCLIDGWMDGWSICCCVAMSAATYFEFDNTDHEVNKCCYCKSCVIEGRARCIFKAMITKQINDLIHQSSSWSVKGLFVTPVMVFRHQRQWNDKETTAKPLSSLQVSSNI